MILTGPERRRLRKIYLAAFDREDLEIALAEWDPPRDFEDLVSTGPFANQVRELLGCAEKQGWLADLQAILHQERPGREDLLQAADEIFERARRREPDEHGEASGDGGASGGTAASRPLWKNPVVMGPVVAALIGLLAVIAAPVVSRLFKPEEDPLQPAKPHLEEPQEVERGGKRVIDMRYSVAAEPVQAALVRLWYRIGKDGEWTPDEEQASTADSGLLSFEHLRGSGVYYFDAVAVRGQERSHTPLAKGQRELTWVRPEQRDDPEVVLDVLEEAETQDVVAGLQAHIQQNKALIDADPKTAQAFESALLRVREIKPQVQKTPAPTPVQEMRERNLSATGAEARIVVPVHFHLLTRQRLSNDANQQVRRQLAVLNRAFHDGGIRFTFAGSEAHVHADFQQLSPGSRVEKAFKEKLGKDPKTTLNVYVVDTATGQLAWSTLPWDREKEPAKDGAVVAWAALPGGKAPFDEGKALVHAVGHWLGLYHTFQNGCAAPGDEVADTPAHSGPNFGKPEDGQRHNACRDGEAAPIHNYMNYVDDAWAREFTPGQYERMRKMTFTYRPHLVDS